MMGSKIKLADRIHNLKQEISGAEGATVEILKNMGAENPYSGDEEYREHLIETGQLDSDQIIDSHCYGWEQWSQWAQQQ